MLETVEPWGLDSAGQLGKGRINETFGRGSVL